MNSTSLLVNTSRAELIEPDALIAALNRVAQAWQRWMCSRVNPSCRGHALLRLEKLHLHPTHWVNVEQDSYELYFGAAFDNVVNFIKGTPTNIVNPGSLQVRR